MRVLIPLLIGAAAVWAQDSGRISGLVTDPSGAAVPKATVNLFLHGGTAAVATTQTNSQGIFTLETLRPLYFDLVVEASGFQQLKLENLKVDPSRTYDVPKIKLDLA